MRRHRFVTCGLALWLLGGCAIKTPYLPIRNWPIAQRASYFRDAAPYRVGVLPLADERPTVERHGQQPTGIFLLLWNRRVGDYTTGDAVFGGQVADQLTGQLIDYLKSANVFADVIRLPAGPPGAVPQDAAPLGRIGREHVVDYLLTGEVQHFYGSQKQHTSIWLLPLYFINTFGWQDNKSLPWGHTAIQFTLHDGRTGATVWRQLVEESRTLPREEDAMSEAAMAAFADAAGELARELRNLPLELPPTTQP